MYCNQATRRHREWLASLALRGAAINAAVFLREFVGDTPWVHLDIAGPSSSHQERGYLGKGATGVGVRTLVEFIRRRGTAQRQ